MRSYNLFCLKGVDGLICAVPEDYAVPPFVTEARWAFGGKLDGSSPARSGFDGTAAATAVRFNGFYLYQNIGQG